MNMNKRIRKSDNFEFMVEYDFLADGRPMQIRTFKDQREAEAFAKEVKGNLVAVKIHKV